MRFSTPLRGTKPPPAPHQVGSLRNMSKSMAMLPGHSVAGGRLRQLFLLYFADKPALADKCCDALGTKMTAVELFPPEDIAELRRQALQLIRSNCPAAREQLPSNSGIDLQADLLYAWATWANDPAAQAAKWLVTGAPAGITVDFSLDGVLEPITDETPLGIDSLSSDFETFSNYAGVESDPEAIKIIDGYIEQGWLREFGSVRELTAFVGGDPILNKFACITKTKLDGTVKRRIIMDSKRSMVTDASRKMYKAVLPRVTDLINDMLALLSKTDKPNEVEVFICDAKDAFW